MVLPSHNDAIHTISPFLNVFKDGHLVESFCLNSRDSFVLGRHTNCDVLLAHPSISRHHLEIQLLHATREILVTDMDSVHGTWIDGNQIPSLIPYTVKEGVAIKLGVSSRTYKVQWLHHPLPASSNERSMTPEALDSNLSNTRTLLSAIDCSSKSSNPSTENSEDVIPMQSARISDSCRNKSNAVCDVSKEERSSPLCKNEVKIPYLANANIVLQASPQQQQKGGLPPLPAATRRTPFAPLPQNTASPAIAKVSKPTKKKLTNGDKKFDMECIDKLRKEREENVLTGSRLWLRRCNSAPSPVLKMSAPIQQRDYPVDKPFNTLHKIRQERAGPENQDVFISKSVPNEEKNKEGSNITPGNQKTLKEGNAPERQDTVCLPDQGISGGSEQQAADQLPSLNLLDDAAADEEYPSDKENQEPLPALYTGKQLKRGKTPAILRKPFQPLLIMPHGVSRPASPCSSYISSWDDKSFLRKECSRPSSVVQNLDYMLQKLKGMAQLEPHYAWHMVVDSTCLLDLTSFKSLQLLEGIKDVRIIIPQIVIRELDISSRKDKNCTSPSTVLKWIEACMLKHPLWIHVQSSSENLPVGPSTPPVSPCHGPSACTIAKGDLMSPTNSDHVLNCALVFSSTVFDGQVALLTNDTALKIKAMAEGIACDAATSFCESLINPYSDRFLWTGSVAHHGPQKNCHDGVLELSIGAIAEPAPPNRRMSFISAARGMASKKKHHVVDNLKNHCKQAQGLKVASQNELGLYQVSYRRRLLHHQGSSVS
ncbi:hypothetical protein GOP47_0027699 [Adiantum capillus-veneris]|nr:hypothetical protein GOP47_0027699 [Adiantum capillus-veneris]